MHRFLLRPKWMALTLLFATGCSLFAIAGFWQLRRLNERRERNALILERRSEPVRSLDDVLADGDVEHRRVRVQGRYDTTHEYVLFGRDQRGQPGNHLLTPLRIDRDSAVLVDRGWVPLDVEEAAPPRSELTVTGVLAPTEPGGALPAPRGERAREVSRPDLKRLANELPYRLITSEAYIYLQTQSPAQERFPEAGALPNLSEGSHRGYAIQWFLFIAIALTVYVAMLRREAKRRQGVSSG